MVRETVFVLGAGASRDAGGPLLSDFDVYAKRVLDTAPFEGNWSREAFAAELEHWTERNSDLDLESLFVHHDFLARQELALTEQDEPLWLGNLANIRTYTNGVVHREYLRYLIFKTVATCVRTGATPTYDRLVAREIAGGRGAIITLNWDTAIDEACTRSGLRVETGHKQLSDPEVLDQHVAPVFHLHGAVNAWACAKCQFSETITIPSAIDRWEFERGVDCPACDAELLPLFVPPLSDKLSRAHVRIVSRVWEAAQNICVGARRLVIVGYSLPDTDVQTRMFLRDALSTSNVESVVIVNPSESVAERFVKAFQGVRSPRRIQHERVTLAEWLAKE